MLKRRPEPELMMDEEQIKAYGNANFGISTPLFIDLFDKLISNNEMNLNILDIGCGPAEISIKLAKKYPNMLVHAIDGSKGMIKFAKNNILANSLSHRIFLNHLFISDCLEYKQNFDLIISNFTLHHFHEPKTFWNFIKRISNHDTKILIMDLIRPNSQTDFNSIMLNCPEKIPAVLKEDLHNSLLASFTIDEVKKQLKEIEFDQFFEISLYENMYIIIQSKGN